MTITRIKPDTDKEEPIMVKEYRDEYVSRCPYCGTVVKGTDYDWTLASIRGIIQRTQ